MQKSREKSAGAVVIKNNNVLVIKRDDGSYGLPKGHIEKNETKKEAAAREVLEETGFRVTIGKRLKIISRANKDITFFQATLVGGKKKRNALFVPILHAAKKMKYPDEQRLLKRITLAAPSGL